MGPSNPRAAQGPGEAVSANHPARAGALETFCWEMGRAIGAIRVAKRQWLNPPAGPEALSGGRRGRLSKVLAGTKEMMNA